MTIIGSRQAQDDLAAIRSFIARDSERYAQLTIERIVTATDQLLTFLAPGASFRRLVTRICASSLSAYIVSYTASRTLQSASQQWSTCRESLSLPRFSGQ